MKYDELPENNLFCPLPWIGGMVLPSGTFMTCCLQNEEHAVDSVNNLRNQTIDEIRRNGYWNSLRKDLINGVQHTKCDRCWMLENRNLKSARHGSISEYQYHNILSDLDIKLDGTLDDVAPIRFWDVRETNLCNMKCVMCHPSLSSLWNEEAIKHNSIIRPVQNTEKLTAVIDASDVSKENILDTIIDNISAVESFYFAGGEPLISQMHWSILDALVQQERFDVRLKYNTNLLKLTWRNKNVLEYWKQFKNVWSGVSIDCIGSRAEYVRYGTVWPTIAENFKNLVETVPTAPALSITTGLMTIGGLKDTLKWAKQFDLEPRRLLCNNIVYRPNWANMKILTQDLKNQLWEDVYKELEALPDMAAHDAIKAELFDEFDADTLQYTRKEFKRHVTVLDGIRGTNFKSACPELADFFDSIEI